MTNKEFEDKKQALRELVYATDNKRKNLVPTANMRIKLSRAINELQPPKPPTCSTCDHINLKCDSSAYNGFLCKNINALNADGDVVSTSGGYNIRIKNIDNFGCIHHSDYGDAK